MPCHSQAHQTFPTAPHPTHHHRRSSQSDPAEDVAQLRDSGGHVLIGTPGRLDDIRQRCSAWLEIKTGEGWSGHGPGPQGLLLE